MKKLYIFKSHYFSYQCIFDVVFCFGKVHFLLVVRDMLKQKTFSVSRIRTI